MSDKPKGETKHYKEVNTQDKFIKRGQNLIMKRFLKDQTFTPNDIVGNKVRLEEEIEQHNQKIFALEMQIKQIKAGIEKRAKMLKQLAPHYDEAWKVNVKECTAAINKVKAECLEKAKNTYEPDVGFPEDTQNFELFNQYRQYIHTHPDIGQKFNDHVIRHLLYKKSAIISPEDVM